MASIIKRCDCKDRGKCPHPWIVRYRTQGGRASRQREQSFADDRREAEDFLLKVEHYKRAHVFIDPRAGRVTFRAEAEAWLGHHLGADITIAGYRSVLRWHVYPAIGDRQIRTIRREDIKEIVATMTRKGLSASRIGQAHLVISAVFNETVRNKKLAESPCTDIPVPACRINQGTTLRIREQVNPTAQLRPLKFRVTGQFRDIPLPAYVAEAIDKHVAGHGTTPDGYLFQGRRHKYVTRRTYQEDFARAAAKAGLPPEFIPHSLRHCYASIALARGIPITEVSRWLGHKSIEVTHQTYGHVIPASWDRARTVFDDARRRQPPDNPPENRC
jgi:site-specific recombinase XerC